MKNISLFVALVVLVLAGAAYALNFRQKKDQAPAPTPTASVSPLPTASGDPGVIVSSPEAGDLLATPIRVTGTATGPWYFEGQFTIILLDGAGTERARSVAHALGDWMTEAPVPFDVILNYTGATPGDAKIILQGANPSGLPENAKTYTVPVRLR